MHRRIVQVAALALSLVGYWLPWLTQPAAALRLNGYELSEWVTFLPGVRDGSLPISRLLFLAPLGCLALLLGLAASWQAQPPAALLAAPPSAAARPGPRGGLRALLPSIQGWGGWVLLVLGLFCAYVVLPPYPYILTAYADPEYSTQFFAASLGIVVLLLTQYLPTDLKAVLQILLAVLGAALGLWGLLAVRPVASALLGTPWPIAWGLPLMLAGFALLALGGLREIFGPRL